MGVDSCFGITFCSARLVAIFLGSEYSSLWYLRNRLLYPFAPFTIHHGIGSGDGLAGFHPKSEVIQ